MPRTERPPGEPEVRRHLIEEARDFEHLMISTMLEDGAESGRYAYNQVHPRLAALESGRAVMFSRSSLPIGHRLSPPDAGHPADKLRIDEHDVITEVMSTAPRFMPPSRAQRRAASWRGGRG